MQRSCSWQFRDIFLFLEGAFESSTKQGWRTFSLLRLRVVASLNFSDEF